MEKCLKCQSEHIYQVQSTVICPMCGFETDIDNIEQQNEIKDAVGNILQDGDSVTLIKDLNVKGSTKIIKIGTKVKTIRLIHDAVDDHDIDCKVDGFGAMKLKSSVVKKIKK